jgi:hypothetical protein
MRIDLLLKRENFAHTFEQSFARYLLEVFGIVADVNWMDGSMSNASLLTNHKLNVIYSKNIDRVKLRSIVSEYAYHPNIVRGFLQKTYVGMAASKYFESFFINSMIEVNPWLDDLDELCIIPGNHSIRIIDLKASISRVVLKEGFNTQFIKNEIYLRGKYNFLPTPELLSVDPNGLWYQETQISAMPLNRLDNKEIQDKILLEAQRSLLSLYHKTLVKVNLGTYFESLYENCDRLIESLPDVYVQDDKDRIKGILEILTGNIVISKDYDIDIVQSHGDFQSANILADNVNQKLYLIDWEYTAMRSVCYDAFVFATKSRYPQGLSKRVRLILNETDISWKWCFKNVSHQLSKLELIIFFIEDLSVRLSELQIPNMINKDSGLDIWLDEVQKIDWLIYD